MGPERARGVARERLRVRATPLVGRLRARRGGQRALTMVVSRRNGGAVVRSRVKRTIREAFRHAAIDLPPDLRVEIGAEGELSRTPRRAIREAAGTVLRRLAEEWQSSRVSHDISAGVPSH